MMIPCCQGRGRCEESQVRADSPRHDMMVIHGDMVVRWWHGNGMVVRQQRNTQCSLAVSVDIITCG